MVEKMKFDVDKLLESELLRRVPKSGQKAKESIKAAQTWLEEAKNDLKAESFRSCILASYLAMFHAARAVLFADGFREKSHFAVARYLEDRYANKRLLEDKWIKLLDHYREMRHSDQHSTSFFASEDEVRNSLHSAETFLQRIRELLGIKSG